MRTKREQIIFQTFHDQICRSEFSSGLTLFFGLHGNSSIRYQSAEYSMPAGALLVVNPFELYQVNCSENAEMTAMQIPENLLQLASWSRQNVCFCYASSQNEKQEYQTIRVLFATIFQDFFQNPEQNASGIVPNVLKLVDLLTAHFLISDVPKSNTKREETMRRMKRIMDHIHSNWNEDISLRELAAREFLSEGYLSRFLKQNLDMTYSQYVMGLRLEHAEKQLRSTDHSITQIAYDCGFHNASAFIEHFRQKHGQTPRQYRQHTTQKAAADPSGEETLLQDGVTYLLQFAVPPDPQRELPHETRYITVDENVQPRRLRHTWKTLLNAGYAKHLLTAAVQQQIIKIQQEIGFRYLRFHGMLDQELHIYQGMENGQVKCCFTYFDMVIDFLLEQGLRPFLEFSFIPRELAKAQTSIFETGSITAACADCTAFGALVEAILRHAICRYGWDEVSQWKFSTFQINYVFFDCMTMDEYLELYDCVYHAVKAVDTRLQFGGPGAMSSVVWDPRGMRVFLQYATAHDCLPDFLTVQSYPHESSSADANFMSYTLSQQSIPSVLSKDTNFVKTFLYDLNGICREFELPDMDIFIEEWNSTLWQRDLSSDTCYKSVWLTKNICENMDAVSAFGYWTISDLMDERANFDSMYHGGYGLFTYNGVPKSGYEALRLLGQLGNCCIASGDGWYFTQSEREWQLILYNYTHYDNIYRYRYRRLEHPEDAYSVFESGKVVRFQVTFPALRRGLYQIEQQEITRTSGSSFDLWLAAGAPPSPDRAFLQYLAEHASAHRTLTTEQVDTALRLETALQPLEVRLFRIRKMNFT